MFAKPSRSALPGCSIEDLPDIVLENWGFCSICMGAAHFVARHPWLRDYYLCQRCGTIPRQRALVEVLNIVRPSWRDLAMHESSPNIWFFSEQCTAYSASFFHPDTPLGAMRDGFRNEDLERLTFPADSFDIFVTQDVLEHVFHPERALKEIMRVLRPGGVHIFTTPKHKHLLKSFRRAKVSDGVVEHLHKPQYHDYAAGDNSSLVTWDYGADFDDLVQAWSGYSTSNFILRDRSRGIDGEYLDVFVTQKLSANRLT